MTFIEKIKIISENGIDFLGYDEKNMIIKKIIDNPKLQKDMLQIPDNFWEDAKNGVLVYSDSTNFIAYRDQPTEQIVAKYQDFLEKSKIPALVYEKQMRKSKIR